MPDENRGKSTDALVELVDIYPTLCELTGIDKPTHLEGLSFAPLLAEPDRKWKSVVFSQFPSPALREWAANPLSPGMRETYFGPLIKEVEDKLISQQKEKWDRKVFENYLMGYTMRTDRYRLILWKDKRYPNNGPNRCSNFYFARQRVYYLAKYPFSTIKLHKSYKIWHTATMTRWIRMDLGESDYFSSLIYFLPDFFLTPPNFNR